VSENGQARRGCASLVRNSPFGPAEVPSKKEPFVLLVLTTRSCKIVWNYDKCGLLQARIASIQTYLASEWHVGSMAWRGRPTGIPGQDPGPGRRFPFGVTCQNRGNAPESSVHSPGRDRTSRRCCTKHCARRGDGRGVHQDGFFRPGSAGTIDDPIVAVAQTPGIAHPLDPSIFSGNLALLVCLHAWSTSR